MLAHTIDADGYMLVPVIVDDSTKDGGIYSDGNTIVVTRCPDGYFKPQWVNGAWVDANAPTDADLLQQARTTQLTILNNSFNGAVMKGFGSSATGTATTFAIDPIAMGKWNGILTLIDAGEITGNTVVKDINGNQVTLTPAQFKQMCLDGFNYFNAQEQNLWAKENDVNAAQTVAAVQAVTF